MNKSDLVSALRTKIIHRSCIDVMSVLCAVLVLASVPIFSTEAAAQAYPAKPIRILVTSAAGSGPDIVARLVGGKLAEALGQQIVVDNRPGASGRIGAEVAARSAPDGYTLLILTSQLTIVDAMYENLKYNLMKDFSPISLLGTATSVLVVNPSVPVTTIKELLTLAKSRPGALKYGSGGSGSSPHLTTELLRSMTGIEILHVPYKASSAALTSTVTGEVDMSFQNIPSCLPLIKSGKLKALGVTSLNRTPLVPDFPSISDTVPGFEFTNWWSLVAPAKTPSAILSKLNAEVVKAVSTAAVRERMAGLGIDTLGTSQQDLAVHMRVQLEKMKEAVRLSGARPED